MRAAILSLAIATSVLLGCGRPQPVTTTAHRIAPQPTAHDLEVAASVGMPPEELTALMARPLYQMKPLEVGRYLSWLHRAEPDLRARIAHLGRKNIGQPYELYLLGEFPYETVDSQPIFSLEKSDCVVFAEHTYAMALSESWEEFFWMLQRIRYKDGVIGVTTRNHYTETDWNRQNGWLVSDISGDLLGERAGKYEIVVDRTRFFKNRYKLDQAIPVETSTEAYVPKGLVNEIASQLQTGDYVNVISGKSDGDPTKLWASHVGLVVVGANGERHLLHSSEPVVREETFNSFIERAAAREAKHRAAGKGHNVLHGFKFLRLADRPEPPPMAPQPRPAKG